MLVLETDFPVWVRTVLQHSLIYSCNSGSGQVQGSTLGYTAIKTAGYLT